MTSEAERNTILRGIAVAGNAVAVLVLIIVLLNAGTLFQSHGRGAPAPSPAPATELPTGRLLFILLDGLRCDVAEDPAVMPHLQALAARGSRGEAWVEALIPSTIAGLRAEVEGIVAPPAGFVFDFASAAAPRGGFLELNRQQGGRSFVAAPWLWRDLYSGWIDQAEYAEVMHGEDQRLLGAGLAAAADPQWRVVVVHLSRPDVAAHLAGGASARYRAAASWCDAAIGQLAQAAGQETTIVVTSDHGTTDRGGHAGPEPIVHRVPVIVAGPKSVQLPGEMKQVQIAELLKSLLQDAPVPPRVVRTLERSSPFDFAFLSAASIALVAGLSTTRLLEKARGEGAAKVLNTALPSETRKSGASWRRGINLRCHDERRTAAHLHIGFWVLVALSFWSPIVAAILGACLLVILERARTLRATGVCLLLLLVGVGSTAWQIRQALPGTVLGDGTLPLPSRLAYVSCASAALLLGCLGGRFVSRRGRDEAALLWGAALVLLAHHAVAVPGETASLSSLDVRAAWAVSDLWAGTVISVLVGALQPYLSLLLLMAGSALVMARVNPQRLPLFAAGAGAILTGQALWGGWQYATTYDADTSEMAALPLGLLVRTTGEVALLFPVLALLSWVVMKQTCVET